MFGTTNYEGYFASFFYSHWCVVPVLVQVLVPDIGTAYPPITLSFEYVFTLFVESQKLI